MEKSTTSRMGQWLRDHCKWLVFIACMIMFICLYAQILTQTRLAKEPVIWNSAVSADKPVGGMTGDVWITQGFFCDADQLSGFLFEVSYFGGDPQGQLVISLLDEAQNVLFETTRDIVRLDLFHPIRILLDEPIQDAQGQHYTICFHCETTQEWQDTITLYYGKTSTAQEPAYLNGQPLEGPIAYQWYGPHVGIQGWLVALALLLLGACALAFCFCEAKRLAPHRVFLLFSLLFCSFYAIAFPFGTVPDERMHYARACTIANGQLFPDEKSSGVIREGQLPVQGMGKSTLRSIWLERGLQISEETSLVSVGNTALYTPVGYLPQALGVRLGMLFSRRSHLVIYVARLVNWAISVAVMYLAIRHTPMGKWVMAGVGLTAMCIQEMVSLSVDGISFALSFAMIAMVLRYYCDPKARVDRCGIVLLLLCSFLLATTKTLYVPISLLALFIPARCFSGVQQHAGVKAGILAAGPCVALAWSRYASSLIHVTANASVDAAAQTAFILEDPMRYMLILFRTLEQEGMTFLTGAVCSPLSLLNVVPSRMAVLFSFLGLAIIFARQAGLPAERSRTALRWTLLVLSGLVLLTSMTGEYLQWTAVGDSTVLGVQGRYFLPLIPLLFLAFRTPDTRPADGTKVLANGAEKGCLWGIFLIAAADVICFMAVLNTYLL